MRNGYPVMNLRKGIDSRFDLQKNPIQGPEEDEERTLDG